MPKGRGFTAQLDKASRCVLVNGSAPFAAKRAKGILSVDQSAFFEESPICTYRDLMKNIPIGSERFSSTAFTVCHWFFSFLLFVSLKCADLSYAKRRIKKKTAGLMKANGLFN